VRIIYDNQIFHLQRYGGVSRYFIELASAFSKMKTEVEIRILAPLHFNFYLNNSNSLRKGNFYIPKSSEMFGFNQLIRQISTAIANKRIDRFYPQVIHETFYNEINIWNSKAPRVLTIYDLIRESEGINSVQAKRKQVALNRANQIICISEETSRQLKMHYEVDDRRLHVVHLGVSSKFFVEKAERNRRKEILFIGQRSGYKDFMTLVNAFSISKSRLEKFRLVAFGGGNFTLSEKEEMKKLGIPPNSIEQIGGNDEALIERYSSASIFVASSRLEGFGLPILESMAAQTPVICSDIAVFREIAGNCARYFSPGNYHELSQILDQVLLENLNNESQTTSGLQRAKEFSWDLCASRTLEVYRTAQN
jgi:glycosyltransferase involved in cell wall biosynthesis